MDKKRQSIDGFTLRRRDDALSGNGANRRAFIDTTNPSLKGRQPTPHHTLDRQPLSVAARPKPQPHQQIQPADLDTEITETLNVLGPINETVAVSSEPAKRRHVKKDKKLKRDKKTKDKSKKHKRHYVKWTIFTILAILVIMGGFFAYRFLSAGGKIFKGNILDAFTSKAKLLEDENGRTNILIFGTSGYTMSENAWDGAFLTDSIMVLSVDQDKHNAYMISLPRDLYVKRTCKALGTTAGKLNESYYCGYTDNKSSSEAGAKALQDKAGEILGLDIQYYVHADWTALVNTVDAVGGVDVMIESDDSRGIYDVATKVKYPNGEAHLNGERALALARSRNSHGGYGLAGGNFDREMYQQKILAALREKALSIGTLANPVTVNSLIEALGDNLQTSFKSSEIQTLIDLASNIKSDSIISLPLVGRTDGNDLMTTGMINSMSVVIPTAGTYNYSDIQEYVSENLTSDPVKREAAVIDVLNGSGTYGLAQKKADDLKDAGYKIGAITNAPETSDVAVTIYQLDKDKSATAEALESKYGVKVKDGKLSGYTAKDDVAFVIVFGASDTN